MDESRLSMPLGEAVFTQRSIRRFKPDPIPLADIELILEAAVKAPNGGNQQLARFLVVRDRVEDGGVVQRGLDHAEMVRDRALGLAGRARGEQHRRVVVAGQ